MFKSFGRGGKPPLQTRFSRIIRIEHGEILSRGDCEAILFFMLPKLEWGGGLNTAIRDLAGSDVDVYMLDHVVRPKMGEVFTLPGFQSPYRYLFMAILPPWDGGNGFEDRDLINCYRTTITAAQELGIRTLAIPALGRDKRDFPHIRFARLALRGILESLDDRLEAVRIMCTDRQMVDIYTEQLEKM